LNAELNPICLLLALLGAHYIFHVSGLRVKQEYNNTIQRTTQFLRRIFFWGKKWVAHTF